MHIRKWGGINMTARRKLLLSLAALTLCGLLVLVLILGNHSSTKKSGVAKASHKVVLTNASRALDSVSQQDIQTIEFTLYDKLIPTIPPSSQKGEYSGTVRQSSFVQTSNLYSDGVTEIPYYSFMVDIPAAKRSFSVALSGGQRYPFDILYVLCPTADQLPYKPFTCQDPEI